MARWHLHPPALIRRAPQPAPTSASELPAAVVPAIELVGVSKSFDGVKVLEDVSLSVAPSETCVVFGTSGSGKTVLLKLVSGLLQPDAGRVRVSGRELGSLHGAALLEARRRVGVLFQAGALFDSMTVFENVAFPLREHGGMRTREIRERVRGLLAQLGLLAAAEQLPAELSGGMVKRVALARALVFDPPVLVLDEPTAGLDPLNTEMVVDLLGRAGVVGGRRRAVLAVVNDVAAAFKVADSLALLHGGRIVEHASPEAFRESAHPAVHAFVGAWLARDALARGQEVAPA